MTCSYRFSGGMYCARKAVFTSDGPPLCVAHADFKAEALRQAAGWTPTELPPLTIPLMGGHAVYVGPPDPCWGCYTGEYGAPHSGTKACERNR